MARELTGVVLWYKLYMLYTLFVAMWSTVECVLIRTLWSWGPYLVEHCLPVRSVDLCITSLPFKQWLVPFRRCAICVLGEQGLL